jgi:hypothetical protein
MFRMVRVCMTGRDAKGELSPVCAPDYRKTVTMSEISSANGD